MRKTDIARDYRKQHGNEMPTIKLARIMYNENKYTFKGVENARSILRMIEGKNGKHNRKGIAHKELFLAEPRPYNPYSLPASDEIEYLPYNISGHKRIGILSDIHAPYHNIAALTAAIEFLKKEKVDAVLLNGDTIDFFRLSRFTKDPRKRDFKGELDTFKGKIS